MGLLARIFGRGKSTKKYEDIYFQARKMGQSIEYAFKQAVDMAVKDGLYESAPEAAKELHAAIEPNAEAEDRPGLEKAVSRIK